MDHFHYRDGELYCEDVRIAQLVARVGTPAYVYSARTFTEHYDRFLEAFAELNPTICYSIKSCGNINLCRLLVDRGAGMDVVSGGELYRARRAGVAMDKVVYAGVGKTDAEIEEALEAGIGYFNIESEAEFENIAAIAAQRRVHARGALRVNPDVADPRTHAKTTTGKKETKFGVDIERAKRFFDRYGRDPYLRLDAIHLHLGSPTYASTPYAEAIGKALSLVADLKLRGLSIATLDIGGGFAADYVTGASLSWKEYATEMVPLLRPFVRDGGKIILEPGRTISANAGVLVSRVLYVKTGGSKKFVIVDTGMHHLIRPTLYEAYHFIWPVRVRPEHVPAERREHMTLAGLERCDVVGPICESTDYLAKDRELPAVARGDLLCVFSAGAYSMVMASQYNAMPRPPEVLIDGERATIIRRRETYADLDAAELETHPA